ncbi:trace amine-associated receptor 13c [Biomphalaria glabrata]
MNDTYCFTRIVPDMNLSETTMITLCAVTSSIPLLAITLNGFVLIAMIRIIYRNIPNNGGNESKITQFLMTSFVTVELLVALFLMPLFIVHMFNNGQWTLGSYVCFTYESIEYVFLILTFVHMMTMSIDMYLAVCHPLKYRMLTSRHARIIVALTWLVPITFSVILLCLKNLLTKETNPPILFFLIIFLIVCLIFLPILLAIIFYALILREVLHFYRRKIALKSNLENPSLDLRHVHPATSLTHIYQNGGRSVQSKSHTSDIQISQFSHIASKNITTSNSSPDGKAAKTKSLNLRAYFYIGGIILVSFIWWMPLALASLYFTSKQNYMKSSMYFSNKWMMYLNVAVNPLIFSCNTSIRNAVKVLLCGYRKRLDSNDIF